MKTRPEILSLVISSVEELNQSLDHPVALEAGEDAALYGRGGVLDSLDLVNLILLVEERGAEAGLNVTLVDDRAMSQFRSPFRSIGSLTDYVAAQAA